MYTVKISKQSLKYIQKQDKFQRARLINAIDRIAIDPSICEPLTNHEYELKYRVGDYRILLNIDHSILHIWVAKVLGRGDVYKR